MHQKPQRPIDKNLKAVNLATSGGQDNDTLFTVTYPATVTGIRWSLAAQSTDGVAQSNIYWALVVVKDGEAPKTLAFTGAASFYSPEQHVLAFGCMQLGPSNTSSYQLSEGHTKTMRKLAGGDTLEIIAASETGSASLKGVVQFFMKA